MGRGANHSTNPVAALRGASLRLSLRRSQRESAARYEAGVDAWVADDLAAASGHFAAAIAADATNADALLGEQYIAPADVGTCERLYVMRSRIGAYQTTAALSVRGRCTPVGTVTLDVLDAPGAALAYAAALAGAARSEEALRVLDHHAQEIARVPADGLRARIAFGAGDYAAAAELSAALAGVPELRADAELVHGAALLFSGAHTQSLPWLSAAQATNPSPQARQWAGYLLGVAYTQSGDSASARKALGHVAAANPGYLDVSGRLRALQQGADATAPGRADVFASLRREFESGSAADDPSIADNR